MRKIYFWSALMLTLTVIILLVTGSPLLTISLNREKMIPFGTLITWAGMVALPFSIFWGVKELRKPSNQINRILSGFLKIVILLGILWVPISYLLAGNLSFTFTEKATFQGGQLAMRWFWILSYGIGIGSMLIITVYWISSLFRKQKPQP